MSNLPDYYDPVCELCGNTNVEYVTKIDDGSVKWWCPNEDCGNNLLYRREDVLRRLWCDRRLTQEEIAERLHTSERTVREWISHHGIERTEHLQTKWVNGYHVLRHKDGKANRKVRLHRLVAVAEYGFDAVKDMDVHHLNGIRWDNRPCNLELLEPEKHGEINHSKRHDRLFD